MIEAVEKDDGIKRGWLAKYDNISDALHETARRYPQKGVTFIERDGREKFLTYSELSLYARGAAVQLNGISSGDVVILQISDLASYVVYFWAIVYRGGVPVPFGVPKRYNYEDRTAGRLISICSDLERPKIVSDDIHIGNIYSLFSESDNEVPRIIRAKRLEDLTNFSETLNRSSNNATAILLQSSGSTGAPKIIPQSHRNILARCDAAIQMNGFSEGDRCLNCFPLDHVVGIVMCHIKDTILGCDQVIADPGLFFAQPLRFLDWCHRFKINVTWAPHSAFNLLLTHLKANDHQRWDLSHLNFMENCSEPIVIEQCEELLRILQPHGLRFETMRPSWGMAETCSVTVVANSLQSKYQRDGVKFTSVGRPFPGVEIRIVDNDQITLTEGKVGRLQIRGPMVLHSYWRRDRALDFRDDWFETGDQAVIVEGELTIVGRDKDTIIVYGNNFSAYEFERAIADIESIDPNLIAAAPVRFKNDATDRVALFVCPVSGNVNEQKIVEKMIELTSVKLGIRPDFICFLPAQRFPRTSVGKIQKTQLAQLLKFGEITPVFGTVPSDVFANRRMPTISKQEWIKSDLIKNFQTSNGGLPTVILGPGSGCELGIVYRDRLRGNGRIVCTESPNIVEEIAAVRDATDGRMDCLIIDDINGSGSDLEQAGLLSLFRILCLTHVKIGTLNIVLMLREKDSFMNAQPTWSRMGLQAIVRSFAEQMAIGSVKLTRVAESALSMPGITDSLCEELLQNNGHTEIEYTAKGRFVSVWNEIDKDKVHTGSLTFKRAIIVGGLGGIGRLIAAELLKRNSEVLFIGRSPIEDLTEENLKYLKTIKHEYGGAVHYLHANLNIEETLRMAIYQYSVTVGQPDIIVHAASEPLQNKNTLKITQEYGSKTVGSWTLVRCAKDAGIPLVVMITSVLGLIGSSNASRYSLANAIQEDLAEAAVGDVDVRTIAFSQVTGVGMSRLVSDELDRYLNIRGLEPLTRDDVGRCFMTVLQSGACHTAVGKRLQVNQADTDGTEQQCGGETNAKNIQFFSQQDIEEKLDEIWTALLKRDAIDPTISVFSYGADSVTVLAAYEQVLRGISKEVTIADMYEFPSVRAMAARIIKPD